MFRRFSAALAALAAFAALAGCAGRSDVYSATRLPKADPSQTAPYLIGPGDLLRIFVWDHKDLSTDVQVRPDGKISTPLVEDLQAAGKTPTNLGRDIEKALKQYVRTPVVTVIVQGFVGETRQQIRVVGQAVQPKALQYRQGMTLLDTMIAVGGLSDYAAGNRAEIVRTINGKETEIRVRLGDLLNNGDIKQNIRMMPGDVLIIPQSVF